MKSQREGVDPCHALTFMPQPKYGFWMDYLSTGHDKPLASGLSREYAEELLGAQELLALAKRRLRDGVAAFTLFEDLDTSEELMRYSFCWREVNRQSERRDYNKTLEKKSQFLTEVSIHHYPTSCPLVHAYNAGRRGRRKRSRKATLSFGR